VKWRLFALTTVCVVALLPAAQGTAGTQSSAGLETTQPLVFVNIDVKITDARITVSPSSVQRGRYARFFVHNVGRKTHSFVIGNVVKLRTLKPKQRRLLLLFLDYRGKLRYYSNLQADRSKPGMKGIFTIR
jgi:hypothetical protein